MSHPLPQVLPPRTPSAPHTGMVIPISPAVDASERATIHRIHMQHPVSPAATTSTLSANASSSSSSATSFSATSSSVFTFGSAAPTTTPSPYAPSLGNHTGLLLSPTSILPTQPFRPHHFLTLQQQLGADGQLPSPLTTNTPAGADVAIGSPSSSASASAHMHASSAKRKPRLGGARDTAPPIPAIGTYLK